MKNLSVMLALCALLIGCGGDDDVEYNEQGIIKAHRVGTSLVTANLYRHNGRRFEAVQLRKDPQYYLLYYSASW